MTKNPATIPETLKIPTYRRMPEGRREIAPQKNHHKVRKWLIEMDFKIVFKSENIRNRNRKKDIYVYENNNEKQRF